MKEVIKDLEKKQEHLPANLKVKFFDLDKGQFKINGTTYYYQPQLKTRRQLKFDQLSSVIGFSGSFEAIIGILKTAHTALTSSNNVTQAIINSSNIIYDGLKQVTDAKKWHDEELVPYVYQMAGLIFVKEGEDTKEFNEVVLRQKYEDFKNSHYSYTAFFLLCLNHIAEFAKIYEEIKLMQEAMKKVQAFGIE